MCKFESSQKDESRAQSADSSNKAYRKPRALIGLLSVNSLLLLYFVTMDLRKCLIFVFLSQITHCFFWRSRKCESNK